MDHNYSYVTGGKSLIGKFFIIASCIGLIGCANPYVGRTVEYSHPLVCTFSSLPTTCHFEDKNFLSEYRISSVGEDGKYNVEGKLRFVGSATWNQFQKSHFTLLLCNEGTIVEAVSFSGGQGSLDRSIHFKKVFSAESPISLLGRLGSI